MDQAYFYIKALHLIFIVTWFAGLFYIIRLFVYHTEALDQEEPERSILSKQLKKMSKLLWYGITWPSAILTLILGLSLIHLQYKDFVPTWLWVKIGFLVGLYAYHFINHRIFKKLQRDQAAMTSQQFRIWNEVATIFLVSIIFLVTLKSTISMVWGLVGLVVFTIVLMSAIKIYKKLRKND
ncbi:MAG: CopD family protein [Bacteroidota bacterium]